MACLAEIFSELAVMSEGRRWRGLETTALKHAAIYGLRQQFGLAYCNDGFDDRGNRPGAGAAVVTTDAGGFTG